jgi:hypothetical protein
VETLRQNLATHNLERTEKQARLIKDTSCAFCGKDLKDVPEVAKFNHPLWARIDELNAAITALENDLADAREDQAVFVGIVADDRKWAQLYAKHAQYIELLDNEVPPNFKWTGPNLRTVVKAPVEELAAAESENIRAARDQGRKANLEAEVTRLQACIAEATKWITELEPLVKADRSAGLETDLQRVVDHYTTVKQELDQGMRELDMGMKHARDLHEMRVSAYKQVKQAHAKAVKDLEELQLNNVLLKKLRGARPKVADKLWGTVLSTISYYFSQIRGVQSVITRDESGFRSDGKPVTGLSGSTLDSLGLAIRIALTKTFLPNNDFLVVDEPAAACDPEREARMLGVIMTAGFSQVLLITHSELADAFADQVVNL